MPLHKGITRKEIVTCIPTRVKAYNDTNDVYNKAYASFSTERASGISRLDGIEGWLSSEATTPCIMKLLKKYGMDCRGSELVSSNKFTSNIKDIPKMVNIQVISGFKIPTGGLNVPIEGNNVEKEIRNLFDYCGSPGRFSQSGGFVIGSKVAHCILPDLCPMLDGKHIAISLYNVASDEYLPPRDNWDSYLGRKVNPVVNPSPRGAGRDSWDSNRFTQAIAFFERIYSDWQIANRNPGLAAFLELDSVVGTTGVPRILDKVLW
jgi:hypothetical protein